MTRTVARHAYRADRWLLARSDDERMVLLVVAVALVLLTLAVA